MRHQADHVAPRVADAGDVRERAVGICLVAEDDAPQVPVLVPERDRLVTESPLHGAQRVPVVERAGEGNDAPAHQRASSASSKRKSSITPLASSRSHIARTRASDSAPASRNRSSMYFPTFTS